jgi:hypothetical protein
MAATSSSTVFAADGVDAATSQVTGGPPVVAGSIESPAECKLFMSIPSCACSPVPSLALVGGIRADAGADTDEQFRMLRRKPQPAMVMTMKETTSLNISVAESEAKLEASACHPRVGGEATSTLMTRCLILAMCSRNLRRTLFQKLSTHEAVKKSCTRNLSIDTILITSPHFYKYLYFSYNY